MQVGYNPAVSGLNLNFNRVHFEWQRGVDGYDVTMQARSRSLRPPVTVSRMQVLTAARRSTFTRRRRSARNGASRAAPLGENGARWLPVRRPHAYAAEVFQVLARARGVVLEAPVFGGAARRSGLVMAEHVSAAGGRAARHDALVHQPDGRGGRHAGDAGRRAATRGLRQSAEEMSRWLQERHGLRRLSLVDHSGLGDEARISAREMVRALVGSGANGNLRRVMRDIAMRDDQGRPMEDHPVEVVAKTGTLYFVSALPGSRGRPRAAIWPLPSSAATPDRRAALDPADENRPPGARSYNARAKALQQALIERWAAVHA